MDYNYTTSSGAYSIGIDINSRKIRCMLIDAGRNIVDKLDVYAEVYRGNAYVQAKLNDAITTILHSNSIAHDALCSIGIAAPSMCSAIKSLPHFLNLNLDSIPASLNQRFGVPVVPISYGAAMGLSEASKREMVVSLDVYETMISAGFIFDGEVCRFSNSRDDIGHMVIDPHGSMCRCGNRGCLEAMGSGYAAIRYYTELTSRRVGLSEFTRLVKKGDSLAIRVLDKCASYISLCLFNLLTIFSPSSIYLGGDFMIGNRPLFELCRENITQRTHGEIPVKMPKLKMYSEAYGAGIYAQMKKLI